MRRSIALAALALSASAGADVASAQMPAQPALQVEAVSDERRRGLSWSRGRPTAAATASLTIADALDASVTAVGLRGSARHGGADMGVDIVARYRGQFGPWALAGGATGHAFVERSGLNYAELDVRLAHLIGPASIGLGASYAPRQDAIGGDNLYLSADAEVAVVGTPWTVRGRVGRSTGEVRDIARARRLRPDGSYWDYLVGVEHVAGPLAAGAQFTATSIDARPVLTRLDDRHAGKRLALYLRLGL